MSATLGWRWETMRAMGVEIRAFVDDDWRTLLEVFRRAGDGAPAASLWGHEESEAAVYLTPYRDVEPESLLVAFVDGTMVGYLGGCLDSARFPSESERMDRAIRQYRLFLRRRPLAFFLRATLDVAVAKIRRLPTAADFDDPRWPSHPARSDAACARRATPGSTASPADHDLARPRPHAGPLI